MSSSGARRRFDRRAAAVFAAVLLAYVVGSEFAFRLADAADLDAVLFVPAGVTAGALLRLHPRRWPYVLAAAATGELVQDLRAGYDAFESLGFVAANVVEPLLAALVVRQLVGPLLDLSFRRQVSIYLAVAVAGAPMIGALIGALSNAALGGEDFAETFVQWWLGDAVGVLLVGTLIVVWQSSPDRASIGGVWGIPVLVGTTAGSAAVVLATDLPLLFVALTGVVVAGAQFGARAVAVCAAASAAAIVICATFDDGRLLAGMSDGTAVIIIKLKLLVFASAGLVVAAEVFERERMTATAERLRAEAEAEHAIVRRLQRLLLPPEHIRGAHFEAFGSYLAGTSALGVGGDWYDVAELPDGRVFITVGDVVGSGSSAAAVMARLRALMLVLAARAGDAGELLTALDEHADQTIDAFGSTVWAGLFDPWTRELSYASAGHPPGFLLPAGRPVVRLVHEVSTPLGVTAGEPKSAGVIVLEGTATIVLYTDGLVEQRDESIDVSLDRLEATLRTIDGRAGYPEALVTALVPSSHHDDTVVLAVAVRPAQGARPDPVNGAGLTPTPPSTSTNAP